MTFLECGGKAAAATPLFGRGLRIGCRGLYEKRRGALLPAAVQDGFGFYRIYLNPPPALMSREGCFAVRGAPDQGSF